MDITVILEDLLALGSVIVVDLALAGDNAIVVAMAARGLDAREQRQVIAIGITIAMLCRMAFAVAALELLTIIGLLLAGGLLLLWVAWKMWRELRDTAPGNLERANEHGCGPVAVKTMPMAILQVVIADVSMSLDNVLAVAGTARHNVWILIFGLAFSVLLMGAAAAAVARFMDRYRWLSYFGLVIVFFVALSMIYEGAQEVAAAAFPTGG